MDAHDDSMPSGLLQRLRFLHSSVSTLMDDPLGEQVSTANYYLTMHCLMLLLFLFGIVDKHLFDLSGFLHDVWPVKSQNFRNPLSRGRPFRSFWAFRSSCSGGSWEGLVVACGTKVGPSAAICR